MTHTSTGPTLHRVDGGKSRSRRRKEGQSINAEFNNFKTWVVSLRSVLNKLLMFNRSTGRVLQSERMNG